MRSFEEISSTTDRSSPDVRQPASGPRGGVGGIGPAEALRLQRTAGNRAVARLVATCSSTQAPRRRRLMRSPLEDILPMLPKLARTGHWDPAMQDALNDITLKYGHASVPQVRVDKKGSADPADWTISWNTGRGWTPEYQNLTGAGAEVRGDCNLAISHGVQMYYHPHLPWGKGFFNESPAGRLIQWLLVGGRHPPGIGSLGKLRISGGELVERPGFAGKVISAMWHPGQARRHITAWHNIRAFLNRLMRLDANKWLTRLETLLAAPEVDRDIRAEVEGLLPATDWTYGDLGRQRGGTLIKAAYVMNSKLRNLWLGSSPENSEIARLSGNVQHYLVQFNGNVIDRDRLRTAIAGLAPATYTAKGQRGLVAILGAIDSSAATASAAEIASAVIGALRDWEVDEPPDAATSLGATERAIHQSVFAFLFQGVALSDPQIDAILTFLLSGSMAAV